MEILDNRIGSNTDGEDLVEKRKGIIDIHKISGNVGEYKIQSIGYEVERRSSSENWRIDRIGDHKVDYCSL